MTAVSIVVPVGGTDAHFDIQLAALAAMRTERTVEIVFAANRSVTPVQQAVDAVVWPLGWRIRTVDATDVVGPSHARNVGWRAARHEIVLFCDADDVVDAEWLEAMALGVESSGLCGGRLEYDRLNPAPLAARVSTSRHALPVKFSYLPFSASCVLGVRRDLLEATGGFDEALHCGEDVDLCWRVAALGVSMVFADRAVVHYRLRSAVRGAFRQSLRYAADDAFLLRRYRPVGARWGVRDTVRELAATAKAVLFLGAGPEARLIAATRSGALCGRLIGSLRHRVYAI